MGTRHGIRYAKRRHLPQAEAQRHTLEQADFDFLSINLPEKPVTDKAEGTSFSPVTNLNNSTNSRSNPKFSRFGPFLYPLLIWVSGLLVMSISRAGLALLYWTRISLTPEVWKLFLIGIRMDVILLSYLTFLPILVLLIFSKPVVLSLRPMFSAWAAALLGLIIFMEIASVPFLAEYDLRPDIKFVEYLSTPREVVEVLMKMYGLELLIGIVVLVVFAAAAARASSHAIRNFAPWSFRSRLICLPFTIVLLVIGCRSSFQHRPANLSTAAFSTNHLANDLALNSTYTLFYAIYRTLKEEANPSRMYGKMAPEEVYRRVGSSIDRQGSLDDPIPFLRKQRSPFVLKRPLNVVIFLQESLGAPDVGCLAGPPITPHLCDLMDEGLSLTNVQATGTRTARGIEAILTGFLPSANKGVIKLENAKRDFFNAANLLKRHGYSAEFHYGGMSNFDEMKAFCFGNGFDRIYDQSNIQNPAYVGTWGVSDEDLVRRANDVFKAHGDQPFFALLLSTSNHAPFEFPDGRIELYEQPKQTNYNAVKYADYAIGLFFGLAKEEEYFKNTLFLVVGDHNMSVRGNDLVPVDKFHVPALIIGPNVPIKEISILSSQVDLLPTLLHFTGLETEHPMVGRNLMDLPADTKGRAFMQFAESNAYRVEDKVIVQQPFSNARQFTVVGGRLVPAELDSEFAADALAYAHLPWLLYSNNLYRLPLKSSP